jgi:hypothetical protein
MAVNNSIYVRRRSKVVLPPGQDARLPLNYVASVIKNLESLGFTFSEALLQAARHLTLGDLTDFYQELVAGMRRAIGAYQPFKPMYPNFPEQVMAMPESELYLNAIAHYWAGLRRRPRNASRYPTRSRYA